MLNARFLAALGVAIILLIGLGYFFYGLQPTLAVETQQNFKIEKGDSFREIGARLSQKSLIKSISVFKIYSILTGKATKFKPGKYNLEGDMSVPEIVGTLSVGGNNEIKVTIPEGSSIADIDKILFEKGVIKKEDQVEDFAIDSLSKDFSFLRNMSSLEGFLFPDTYRFHLDSNPEKVVRVMLKNFEEKAWKKLEDKDNWYDDLILASFLEKEVPEYEDRQIVAGILMKRLNNGMPLQVDATISYVKCDGAFLDCDKSNLKVVNEDLDRVSSPYNTYKRKGWTPTPISNPGLEAIKAAINPKPSPYWYYLSAKEDGETIFSKTLEEHNINRYNHL